jgi:transcription factor SPN1
VIYTLIAVLLVLQAKNKKKSKGDRKGKGKAAEHFDDKSAKKKDPNANEGDAYDSGDEAVEDDTDRNFLASDDSDDDLGLGETYNKKQNFDDERAEGFETREAPKKKKGGGGGGGGRIKNSDNPLDQALTRLAAGKSRKAVEIDERKLQEKVQDFLYSMDEAAEEDRKARNENKPAVKKITMLPKVLKMIGNKHHQSCLLEFDLLGAIKKWISPLDDGTLPSHSVRKALYGALENLPVEVDHLKRSGLGKTIFGLYRHAKEDQTNKQGLKLLIERWARPVFDKTTNWRTVCVLVAVIHSPACITLHLSFTCLYYAPPACRKAGPSDGRGTNPT